MPDWHRLGRDTFEDIACCLLEHLYNTSEAQIERLDGAGGDGGRDLTITKAEGTKTIYQVKHFPDRLTKSRKDQIRRSLRRAARHSPDDWVLILSKDMTESEVDWFEGLKKLVPFTLSWRGRNWLNVELGQRPWIVSGLAQSEHERLLKLLSELRLEQEAIINSYR